MGAKWISQLWGRLREIRKSHARELEEINTIIFGDPLEIAEYYIEPDCQERNPTDQDVEPHLIVSVPVMKKIDQFFQAEKIFHHGNNQMFILSDAGMGKTALLTMLRLLHLMSFWPKEKDCVLKKLRKETLREVSEIENKSQTILLLDSLDEDPTAFGKVRERLLEILHATQHFCRVIITCRTQSFPDTEEDSLERLGMVSIGGFNCPVKYLSSDGTTHPVGLKKANVRGVV